MKTWYAKQLSKLANVSVRTLHYYDKIDLLKPGIRKPNGYRLYSETDLVRLQQIVALKFFGFELSQIKDILSNQDDVLEHFSMQQKFLQQKAKTLLEASDILQTITGRYANTKSIPWEKTIELIEVFQMNEQLEYSWVKEIFNEKELKEYAEFEANLKTKSSPEDKARFEQEWGELIEELNNCLALSPSSEKGIELGEKFMAWVNKLYGKKYAHLRTKKMEQGFGEGKGLDDVGFTKESVAWIDKAMDAYWHKRIYAILKQVGKINSDEILKQWNTVLDDMYGNQDSRKAEIFNIALGDKNVSNEAKEWLKSISNKK